MPAALVAGAVAPDAPYFLRALRIPVSAQSWWEPFLNATTTHGWPGAITVAIPTALVLYLALASCDRPARWALPAALGAKAADRTSRPLWLVWVALSLVLGVVSHVAWDSFTHSDGWAVENVALLRTEVLGALTAAHLLQHLSTALGLTALLVFAWRRRRAWLVPADPVRRVRFQRVTAVIFTSAVVAATAVVLLRDGLGAGAERLLASAAIGAGLGAAAAAASLSALWWLTRPDLPRTKK